MKATARSERKGTAGRPTRPSRSTRPRRAGGRGAQAAPREGKEGARAKALVAFGRMVLETESRAIGSLHLDGSFATAVEWILSCKGQVVLTGIGKPGFVAQKISATLASTGTHSIYLHPAEAAHGDLGRLSRADVLVALSNSGESEEILRLLPAVKRIGARVVAVTRDGQNPLARAADLVLAIGDVEEACPMGLAPTTSTAALLAVGDALAMAVLENRPFSRDEYALYHPGGKLGRHLMKVHELMRAGEANPLVRADAPLREVVSVMTRTPGRPGAATVVDGRSRLLGVFTDGDLRRLVERGEVDFAAPMSAVMTRNPRTVRPDERLVDAARVMREARIDQVPVVDAGGRAVGLLDVQDLLAARIL
jgi:arabinose-5-phosphate isomerase